MKRLEEVTIGERLRRLRERLQLTQEDVADASGIRAAVISRYERDAMTPGWGQIEKILAACEATPCDLFDDYCANANNEGAAMFEVPYFDRRPQDPETCVPSAVFNFRKTGPLTQVMGIAPVDNRYSIVRAISDMMIPDIYPGDLMLADTHLDAKPGRVIAGYYDGEALMGRLTRHKGGLVFVPSNRRYPAFEFDAEHWDHRGCIIFAVRDMTVRFVGSKGFVDETSDVFSLGDLKKSRGGGGDK